MVLSPAVYTLDVSVQRAPFTDFLSQLLSSLVLWSCGRRVSVVQAQRQIHRAFRPHWSGSQSFILSWTALVSPLRAASGIDDPIQVPWATQAGRLLESRLGDAGDRPNEADHLAGDRRGDDDLRLAGCGQSAISRTEPDLRFPCYIPNGGGQRFETVVKLTTDSRLHAVCPGAFDQHAPGQRVAGLSDAAARMVLPDECSLGTKPR